MRPPRLAPTVSPRSSSTLELLRSVFVLALLVGQASLGELPTVAGQESERLPGPMYFDPEFQPTEVEVVFRPGLRELWLQALAQDEVEMQVQAADAFRRAYQNGYRDVEGVPEVLLQLFAKPQLDRLARIAVARALVELDVQEAAPLFAEHANKAMLDLALVLEPAIADWQNESLVEQWLERIKDPYVFPERFTLASSGLAKLQIKEAEPILLKIVLDKKTSAKRRLASARALSKLAPNGYVETAAELYAEGDTSILERLLAVQLIAETDSSSGRQLQFELSHDPDPAIARVALEPLWSNDPERLLGSGAQYAKHSGPLVRLQAVDILAETQLAQNQWEPIEELFHLLNDPHPEVRIAARERVTQLIEEDRFVDQIWEVVDQRLSQGPAPERWRANEQLLLLVGNHDRKSMVQLATAYLNDERHETAITAAWCLQTLNVPDLAEAALQFCQRVFDETRGTGVSLTEEQQLSQLFQFLGQQRYQDADPLLRKFIPKDYSLGLYSRAAAIWALGHIHEEDLDEELNDRLAERMVDTNSVVPEIPLVRFMSCNAIGRSRDERHEDKLRTILKVNTIDSFEGQQAAWALNRLFGDPIPGIGKRRINFGVWFVEPIAASPSDPDSDSTPRQSGEATKSPDSSDSKPVNNGQADDKP